jgi:hypothetical protein
MLGCFICNSLFQLQEWSFCSCDSITYAGIKDIIKHCKELCYLKLENMLSFNRLDKDIKCNAIYEQLLQSGKVDHTVYNPPNRTGRDRCDYFNISKFAQSPLTHEHSLYSLLPTQKRCFFKGKCIVILPQLESIPENGEIQDPVLQRNRRELSYMDSSNIIRSKRRRRE